MVLLQALTEGLWLSPSCGYIILTKKDTQMARKHMKMCSLSWVTREMQTKITVRYHCMSSRELKFKRFRTPNIGEDGKQLKCSYIIDKMNHTPNLWPSNSAPRYLPKRKENILTKTCKIIFITTLFKQSKPRYSPNVHQQENG